MDVIYRMTSITSTAKRRTRRTTYFLSKK